MRFDKQSNTRFGGLVLPALEDLTGMEGRLCFLLSDQGAVGVVLASGQTDIAPYLLLEGGVIGARCQVLPLQSGYNVRLCLSGPSVSPGNLLVVADGDADPDVRGMVTKYDSSALQAQRAVAIAEEAATAGALVLCRPFNELIPLSGPTPDVVVFKGLPVGQITGSFTGLTLPSAPRFISLSVYVPNGGEKILAWPVEGSESATGFSFVLQSAPESTGLIIRARLCI